MTQTTSSPQNQQEFTPVIGMEIHVEMRTQSKMFCGCPAEHFGVTPNSHTCPVCLGLPGALPIANEEGIRRTIMIGRAFDCSIAEHSKFDRKNYFYPDLPKGYQISQYDQPLCVAGEVETSLGPVRITRVHLEEDTAKLQHVTLTPEEMKRAGVEHSDVSLLDFNRSGVPLVEIVTEPDIRSGAHAREFGKQLVQILRYLGVSDCDMEKGSLRLEANISVQSAEEKAAGQLPNYKIEVKNLNSFRFLERSIDYEIERQSQLRRQGETPRQETRGWNDDKGVTFAQRSKESAEDYRYFPDPDLAPLEISPQLVQEIEATLPELPHAKYERFIATFGISDQNADVLTADRVVAEVAEQWLQGAQAADLEPQKAANAIVNKQVDSWLMDSDQLTTTSSEKVQKHISSVIKQVQELYATEAVSDDEIRAIVDQVLADPSSQEPLEKYRAGKTSVIGFFMGQVMRRLGKKVDANQVQKVLKQVL